MGYFLERVEAEAKIIQELLQQYEKRQMMEVCSCENCGNEAEMVVTCEFIPVEDVQKKAAGVEKQEKRSFTCTNCGSEADTIVDL